MPLDDLNDSLCITEERSQYEYLAISEASSFLSLETTLKVVNGMLDHYFPEVFYLLLLVVLYEYMIEVALYQHVSIVQRFIIRLNTIGS